MHRTRNAACLQGHRGFESPLSATPVPRGITLGRVPNSRARRSSSPDWRRSCWPGIVSATALAASVSEPERCRSGRQFAASCGTCRGHAAAAAWQQDEEVLAGREDDERRWRIGQTGSRDTPRKVSDVVAREAERGPAREDREGQRSTRATAWTGRTQDCTRPTRQKLCSPAAMREPSTQGSARRGADPEALAPSLPWVTRPRAGAGCHGYHRSCPRLDAAVWRA